MYPMFASRRSLWKRALLTAALLGAGLGLSGLGVAQAQVGQLAAPLLAQPTFKDAKKAAGGVYLLADGLVVQLNERGGYLLSATVTAPFSAQSTVSVSGGTATVQATTPPSADKAKAAAVGGVLGVLSGYGDGLAQPLAGLLTQPDALARLPLGINIDATPFMISAQTQGKLLRLSIAPAQINPAAFGKGAGVHVLAPKKAAKRPVVLRVYSDFQCPYCQQFEAQTLPALSKQLPDDVQIEFHQFPLESIHPLARPAAEASECAEQQGKFWPFKEALFADRAWLSGNPNVAFIAQAGKLGLNVEAFKSCLAERGGKAAVDAGLAEAASLGLNSTPTVFVNGYRAQNPYDAAGLLRMIDFARVAALAPAGSLKPVLFPAPVAPKP